MLDLYRKIWQQTGSIQFLLIGFSVAVAGLAAVQLQYQKDIINRLAGDMEQSELLLLGAQFFGILLLSGAVKFALNYRSSVLGEKVVRTLRGEIFKKNVQVTAFGKSQSGHGSAIGPIITSEAEQVGKFAGSAVASPLMEIGTVVAVVAFIAATQALLGAFVVCIVAVQAVIVMWVQRRVNSRVAERVKLLRRTIDRLSADDLKAEEQGALRDFDEIFEARRKIFFFKFSTKFALNVSNAVGTAGILTFGGWLVLEGRTDIGTVVADLAGLARIAQPWRSLIAFYRNLSVVQVHYGLLKEALPR